MRRLAAAAVCILGLACAGKAADDGLANGGASYLTLPLSARAIGMGHAQTAVTDGDASAVYANSALMALQLVHRAALTTGDLGLGRTITFAGYIFPLRTRNTNLETWCGKGGKSGIDNFLTPEEKKAVQKSSTPDKLPDFLPCEPGTEKINRPAPAPGHWDEMLSGTPHIDMAFGAGFTYLGIRNLDGRSEFGAPESGFSDSEKSFAVEYAMRPYDNLSIGIGGKYLAQDLQTASAKGQGVDLGLWYGVPFIRRGELSLAVTGRDLGGKLKWKVPDPDLHADFTYREPVSGKWIIGASYLTPGEAWLFAADLLHAAGRKTRVYGGLEWRPGKVFNLRAGASANNPTFGFSWLLPGKKLDFQLDYAYEYDLNSLSNPQWLTLTLHFLPGERAS